MSRAQRAIAKRNRTASARAARLSGKARDKKYGYESILLRVRPEVREMLDATVEGMNAQRKPGDPPYTVTGVILMAIASAFGAPAVDRAHKGAA
jgi:hypothetical protein